MVYLEGDAEEGEIAHNAFEVLLTPGAQVICAPRRRLGNPLTGGLLAVEKAQRILPQPPFAIGAKEIDVLGVVFHQPLKIAWSAHFAPDAIEQQGEPSQPQRGEELPHHFDHLCVQGGVAIAYGLKAELLMLSVSPPLRPLIPEDGGEVVKPHRLGQVVHPMLYIGTTDGGGALGAQRHHRAAAIEEGVGLLLHNIGLGADGAHKEAGILENGGIDALIAIELT